VSRRLKEEFLKNGLINEKTKINYALAAGKFHTSKDEADTEAAAATALVVPTAMPPEEPVEVTVDRPFVFLIHDIETGTILFVGRIVDPSA